jgi:hypothetical protein
MKAAPVLAGLALIAAGCDHGPSKAEKAALAAVASNERGQTLVELFPSAPRTKACAIPMGGPAPGSHVSGSCTTDVTIASDGSASVQFREGWDRDEFHAEPGSSRRRAQSHTWTFAVSKAGRVVAAFESGDTPPQYIP